MQSLRRLNIGRVRHARDWNCTPECHPQMILNAVILENVSGVLCVGNKLCRTETTPWGMPATRGIGNEWLDVDVNILSTICKIWLEPRERMACNGKPGTEFGQKNYMIDSIKMRSYRLRSVIATTFPSSTARVMSLNTTNNADSVEWRRR